MRGIKGQTVREFSLRIYWVIRSRISAIQYSKLFKEEEKVNSLSGSSDIYTTVCLQHTSYIKPHIAAQWFQEDGYPLWKSKDQELNPVVPQIENWTSDKISLIDPLWEYFSSRIETIQVLYLTDQISPM